MMNGKNVMEIRNVHVFNGYEMTDMDHVFFDADGLFCDSDESSADVTDGRGMFLMPGLIDAHTHPVNQKNLQGFMKNGVTSSFAISAPDEIRNLPESTRIFSTYSMALGNVRDGREFVRNEIAHGSAYIKIVIEDQPRMAGSAITQDVINEIADETHRNGYLLAVHAVSVPTLEMAVKAGTDIHIHVPLEDDIPDELIDQMAANHACCVPTLTMMKGFSDSLFYGYHRSDFRHAVNNVRKMHEGGIPILGGTDANNVFILPRVRFGTDLHTEMKLLSQCGLSDLEILQSVTSIAADGFHNHTIGSVQKGRMADFILIDGNPLENLSDIDQISQVWIGGKRVL